MLNYTPKLQTSILLFDQIIEKAKADVKKLSKVEQLKLKDELDHGAHCLTTKKQLKMYLASYGEIHQAKLMRCYRNIPSKVWCESQITIVDYGCGQGIAEIVFADFLSSKWIEYNFVKDIILIDPSRICLMQSVEFLSSVYRDSDIIGIQKNDKQIREDDLMPKSNTVIHILSNIVDLDNFQGNRILSLLNEDKKHNNIIICVSPYYQEDSRGKRIDEFCSKLQGYRCVYKFQKHIDEWSEKYSCQIRIYESLYY